MPRSAVSHVCMWALTRPGMTILSVASIVSSAAAARLRPTARISPSPYSSSPPLKSPMAGSSVTSQPHLISTRFMGARPLSLFRQSGLAQACEVSAAVGRTAERPRRELLGQVAADHAGERSEARTRLGGSAEMGQGRGQYAVGVGERRVPIDGAPCPFGGLLEPRGAEMRPCDS